MPETDVHKKYMKKYRTEQERDVRRQTLKQRQEELAPYVRPVPIDSLDTIASIARIRHAAEFVRSSSSELTNYDHVSEMSMREALLAIDFGVGYLPWPSIWNHGFFELATKGWTTDITAEDLGK
jgi:hypothetical protein